MARGASTVAAAIGPWGIGFAAATTAVGAFAYAFRDQVEPLEDVIDRHRKAVSDLRDAYGLAASAAGDFGQRARSSLMANARDDRVALKQQRASLEFAQVNGRHHDAFGRASSAQRLFREHLLSDCLPAGCLVERPPWLLLTALGVVLPSHLTTLRQMRWTKDTGAAGHCYDYPDSVVYFQRLKRT